MTSLMAAAYSSVHVLFVDGVVYGSSKVLGQCCRCTWSWVAYLVLWMHLDILGWL